ncbi:hypothetical protein BDZ91DRAFT_754679 [Kalaharituber pfeilii]|nr:hypothetical protein BDZ91DRAFT_754679 [Kalaharituber pfeilii]
MAKARFVFTHVFYAISICVGAVSDITTNFSTSSFVNSKHAESPAQGKINCVLVCSVSGCET